MAQIRILDDARRELEAILAYLHEEDPVVAKGFLRLYQSKLRQIQKFPRSGPSLKSLDSNLKLRKFSMRRFPYAIIIGEFREGLTVIAVVHTSREPGYWKKRLQNR